MIVSHYTNDELRARNAARKPVPLRLQKKFANKFTKNLQPDEHGNWMQ